MKNLILVACCFVTEASLAQVNPDFGKIFRDLEKTQSISEAIRIREDNLKSMRNLVDFNRLTDLEATATGEEYFTNYRRRLANFILSNIRDFINPDMKNEKAVFMSKILPKLVTPTQKREIAEWGLAYVGGCEEFKDYAVKTDPGLKKKYMKKFCQRESGAWDIISVLFQPRTLEEGRYDVIHFGEFHYVKKIYISAEGVAKDAYFDVMVNGEVKGTIYVPGRDPSYVVTVEDYADQIFLRSLSGKARILSVVLQVQ